MTAGRDKPCPYRDLLRGCDSDEKGFNSRRITLRFSHSVRNRGERPPRTGTAPSGGAVEGEGGRGGGFAEVRGPLRAGGRPHPGLDARRDVRGRRAVGQV